MHKITQKVESFGRLKNMGNTVSLIRRTLLCTKVEVMAGSECQMIHLLQNGRIIYRNVTSLVKKWDTK